MVVATERKFQGPDTRLLWRELAYGGYAQHEVPTTSSGRLLQSPHVEAVAKWIREALGDARQAQGALTSDRVVGA
jgi:hypothetical protein